MRFVQILLPVLAFATLACAQYPQDLYLPIPSMFDSVSIRRDSSPPGYLGRTDVFTTRKDSQGRPLRQISRQPSQVVDSAVFDYEWNLPIVVVGQAWPASASRSERSEYSKGVLVHHEIDTTIWVPAKRTLVQLKTPADTGCPWNDSIQLDDRNRVTYSSECSWLSDGNGFDVFRAWYESPTDTLPRRSSERWNGDGSLEDSVFSVGPANRPDTLRGSEILAIFRDGDGRVLKLRAPNGLDSSTFAYDRQGRLIREQNPSGYSETYVFSWSDDVGVHLRPSAGTAAIRLSGGNILLVLPLSGSVRIDALSDQGRTRLLFDGFRPSGAARIPVQLRPGEIVRVRATGLDASVRSVK